MSYSNNISKELKEFLDEVLPPYKGDLRDAIAEIVEVVKDKDYYDALKIVSTFNPNISHTTAEWYNIDWALSVPGIAQMYPELVPVVKAHFSITLNFNEIALMIEAAMIEAYNMDPCDVESYFESYMDQFGDLPDELAETIQVCFNSFAMRIIIPSEY